MPLAGQKSGEAERLFWGKIEMEKVLCFMYYRKKGMCQSMIHELKYGNRPEVGVFLGRLFGIKLHKQEVFDTKHSLLIPVPLHTKKRRKRGYNQSEAICRGLSSVTGITVDTGILNRVSQSVSQTRKRRFSRWQNTLDAFELSRQIPPEITHIVIVDDIITTGSTMESAAKAIKKQSLCKISALALGFTVAN
jgi:ComF family protein